MEQELKVDNFLEENRDKIFIKYSEKELLYDIHLFSISKGRLGKVLNNFFEEEMYKCKSGKRKLSPMEALEDDSIVENILSYTRSKRDFYTDDDLSNIKSFLRNGGMYARKVANFPPQEAARIYGLYTKVGDNIFDMSCGFGSRMSACLLARRNYYGTDPNKTLFKKLEEYRQFFKDNNLPLTDLFHSNIVNCNLFCQGSEDFIPELEGKIDFCFSSPPYFDLESYGDDEGQSIKKFSGYRNWLDGFMKPTTENCYRYLKIGKFLAINIKNIKGSHYRLFDDTKRIIENIDGFEYIETITIEQTSSKKALFDFRNLNVESQVKEPVMIFKKVS